MTANAQSRDKVEAIQLLRALAAAIVAIAHQAFAFADNVGDGLGIVRLGAQAGQVAVAVFFVVSGYIMVVSSRSLYGQPGARRRFWTRRAVRILPPYWLATLALVAVFLFLEMPVDGGELLRSLALWPYWPAGGPEAAAASGPGAPLPLLWPGWTLFYELVFYALFGLLVTSGRRAAVLGAAGGIALLVAIGLAVPPQFAPLFALTRPVLLVFVAGLALGWMRERGLAIHPVLRSLAALVALFAVALAPEPARTPGAALGFAYLGWAGLPAALIGVALLGGPLRLPAFAVIDRLGDWSYALYLLHVPMAWLWIWAYQRAFNPASAWGFLITLVIATYIASWLFFRLVERPMTRGLNRMLGASARGDSLLQRTGI